MSNLKRLGATVILTFVLGLSAFAGETNTPPCAPGEMQTPPCAYLAFDNVPGQIDTPPSSEGVDVFSLAVTALALVF